MKSKKKSYAPPSLIFYDRWSRIACGMKEIKMITVWHVFSSDDRLSGDESTWKNMSSWSWCRWIEKERGEKRQNHKWVTKLHWCKSCTVYMCHCDFYSATGVTPQPTPALSERSVEREYAPHIIDGKWERIESSFICWVIHSEKIRKYFLKVCQGCWWRQSWHSCSRECPLHRAHDRDRILCIHRREHLGSKWTMCWPK